VLELETGTHNCGIEIDKVPKLYTLLELTLNTLLKLIKLMLSIISLWGKDSKLFFRSSLNKTLVALGLIFELFCKLYWITLLTDVLEFVNI
jgi:hypothetical protein